MIAGPHPRSPMEHAPSATLPPLRILLIRHGQTAWNIERRILGRTDIPLDDVGRDQAARLATVLPGLHALYASPLSRALETARALGRPVTDPDLMEMDQGELDGLGVQELAERHAGLTDRWREDPAGFRLPGGETLHETQARGMAAIGRIAARHGAGEVVGVVTHQLLLASSLCALSGEPLTRWRSYVHRNTAWAVVEFRAGVAPVVLALDQAPHITPPP